MGLLIYFYADDQQLLQRECTKLVNFETSREDLLKESEKEVSTTATTPKARTQKSTKESTQKEKATQPTSRAKPQKNVKRSTPKATPKSAREAELVSAIQKAKSLFSAHEGTSSSSTTSESFDSFQTSKKRPKPSFRKPETPYYEDDYQLQEDEFYEQPVQKRPKYDYLSSDSSSESGVLES